MKALYPTLHDRGIARFARKWPRRPPADARRGGDAWRRSTIKTPTANRTEASPSDARSGSAPISTGCAIGKRERHLRICDCGRGWFVARARDRARSVAAGG